MRRSRLTSAALLPAILLIGATSAATAQDRPFHPTTSGREARHDGWNSDGAPAPPHMWRGHGGLIWTNHYQACRKAFGGRFDYRTDMVGRGKSRRRCSL